MKFFLVTADFDSLENRSPDCETEYPLEATEFDAAVEEAKWEFAKLPRYSPGAYANNRTFPQKPRLMVRLD